jgi:hypothetical protein
MAENDVKIIKYTISGLLAGREHSKHELLKKILQRTFGVICVSSGLINLINMTLPSTEKFTVPLTR